MSPKRLAKEKDIDTENHNTKLPYDVLTIIFKNLNGKNLCNAAMVCRSWMEAANNEKRLRGPYTMLQECNIVEFWDSNYIEQCIDLIKMKPLLSFVFTAPKEEQPNECMFHRCPCPALPSSCRHIVIGNYGIIKGQTELENNTNKKAWTILPYDKDVSVDVLYDRYPPLPGSKERNEIQLDFCLKHGKVSYSPDKPKCLIYLTREECTNEKDKLWRPPRDPAQAIWGGVACDLSLCKTDKYGMFCSEAVSRIAVVISGNNVKCWSVVLREKHNTKVKIEEKLMRLKTNVELKRHSMGFMFACCGRGDNMFHEKNVESTIFNKVFPKVPLVGSFGGGEYGSCMVEQSIKRHHEFSTVIMILTYG